MPSHQRRVLEQTGIWLSTSFASWASVFLEQLKRDWVPDRRLVPAPFAGRKHQLQRPLSAQDAARFAMSTRHNPMIITAALLLDAPVERAPLLDRLEDALKHDVRWTSRVTVQGPLLHPRWRRVANMVWGEHVEQHCLSEALTLSSLQAWMERVARRPLPKQKPLWRLYLVTGSTRESAFILRVHHCVADGGSLLGLLDALCEPVSGDRPISADRASQRLAPTTLQEAEPEAVERSRSAFRTTRRRPAAAISPLRSLMSPITGWLGARDASEPGPRLSGDKRLGSTRPLPLDALRASARRLETRLTPLLLSATVSGLSTGFTLERKESPASLLALVPVDLRKAGSASGGNRFASGLVRLPARPADAAERLRVAHGSLNRLKGRPHADGWGRWIEAAGLLPRFMQRLGVWWVTRQVDLSLSSIKGPRHPLSLLGACVQELVVWSPAAGHIGLSVTWVSYAGWMRMGILADDAVVSDPNKLASLVEAELADCAWS